MSGGAGRQRLTRELLFGAFVGPQSEAEDPRIRERVISSIEERECEPGDTLFEAGDASHHVHFMTEGRIRLHCDGAPDWIYDGRWVIGTTDVLVPRPRKRTATVETPMRTFRIPAEFWFNVMRDRPAALLNTILGYVRGSIRYIAMLAPSGAFPDRPRLPPFDPTTLSGRMRAFEAPPLLAGMPAQLLLELAAVAEVRALAAEETLFVAGTPHPELAVVASGEIEVSRRDPAVVARFGPGELPGGPVCVSDLDAQWTARATTESRVLVLPLETLYDCLEDHSDGMRALMTTFALEQERLCEALAARDGEIILH